MDLKNIHGIVFLYNAVIDNRGDRWPEVLLEAFHSVGLELDSGALCRTAEAVGTYLITDNLIQPTDDFTTMMGTCVKLMLQRLSDNGEIDKRYVDDQDTVDSIAAYCIDYMNARFAVERPVLERLSAKMPLVMLSGNYPNLMAVLNEFGMSDLFRDIIINVDPDNTDEALAQLKRAASATGASMPEILFVGYTGDTLLIKARDLGCRVLMIDSEKQSDDASETINKIASLNELAKQIL